MSNAKLNHQVQPKRPAQMNNQITTNLDDCEHYNNNNENDDLSITLIERRKRLHELAVEINQWEDEAVNKKNINNLLTTSTNMSQIPPQAPPLNELINKQQQYYSPKQYNTNPLTQSSKTNLQNYSIKPLTNTTTITNKENQQQTTPIHKSTTNVKKIVTPTSSEILDAAQRILAKKQSSNTNLQNNKENSNSQISSSSLVKNIKSKFENYEENHKPSNVTIRLTPKSIIKKFELMSTQQQQQLSSNQPQISTQISTNTLRKVQPQQQQDVRVIKAEPQNESTINTEHIKPKKIIEKFEQLLSQNNGTNVKKMSTSSSISNTNDYSTNLCQTYDNTTSLTNVSSIQSSPRQRQPDETDQIDFHGKITKRSQVLYLEVDNYAKNDQTSLFDDEEDDDDTLYTQNNKVDANNSITGTSYSGTFMNEEEFQEDDTANDNDDHEDGQDDEDDLTENDDEDMDDLEEEEGEEEDDNVYDSEYLYTSTTNNGDKETYDSLINEDNTTLTLNKYSDKNETQTEDESKLGTISEDFYLTDCSTSTAKTFGTGGGSSVDTQSSESNTHLNDQQQQSTQPLVSIKEYRKQKRTFSGRRSSIVPKLNSKQQAPQKPRNSKNDPTSDQLTGTTTAAVDDQKQKQKCLERIKELEDLIKQEDNIIHQTGIALERCLHDQQFSGSSEHIECNRLLLISCQKRQAYSSEIVRLKQQQQTNKNKQNCLQPINENEMTSEDLVGADLTGILVFSDIQLPIKEAYLNKLKSGDDKRIFYFLCLIRNGIQVLQTQVMSVQELIQTRGETSITFPNRMSINSVDINFKVKIDVYMLEVVPRDQKQSKHNLHATAKFFSPFKNNLFSSSSSSSSSSGQSNHPPAHNQFSSNSHHHFNEPNSYGLSSNSFSRSKTSNFIQVDTIEITIKDINNKRFKLNISSSSIPLTGQLFVNLTCMPSKQVELRGFMTLFEDTNNLGSWDRRWCYLNHSDLTYWKYPEDEYRDPPLGLIDLKRCLNEKISILPRDLCARKYTMELTILSSSSSCLANDQANEQNRKVKRYRLSADTREQANEWLNNLNFALASVRLWNPNAIKPIKSSINKSKM